MIGRGRRIEGEFAAQLEDMKKQTSRKTCDSELIHPPAFPVPGNKLFEHVGAAVGASRGYSLGNLAFARLIGRSESTTSFWFGVSSQPHLVSWLCLLEQLVPLERHRVVDELCRDLPQVDHPRLKHNPATVGVLKKLLAKNTGLTFITGGTAPQRTFVLTALGHTFCRVDRLHRNPAGLDIHEPSWFVPVETLLYLRNCDRPGETQKAVRKLWPQLRTSQKPLILLNGIWSLAPELRKDIVALAGEQRHVVVADQELSRSPEFDFDSAQPVHTLRALHRSGKSVVVGCRCRALVNYRRRVLNGLQ